MSEIPTTAEIKKLLAPFRAELNSDALARLQEYLDLLIRWNQRMNLTAVRSPNGMIRDLFGESLFLASLIPLQGHLIDLGSGAGFPGLALKLAAPDLRVTLIESNRKKCTFLKEVVRVCGFDGVEVVAERFESWKVPQAGVDLLTTRAVDRDAQLLEWAHRSLREGGCCALFITMDVVSELTSRPFGFEFGSPVRIPESERRIILLGRKNNSTKQ